MARGVAACKKANQGLGTRLRLASWSRPQTLYSACYSFAMNIASYWSGNETRLIIIYYLKRMRTT